MKKIKRIKLKDDIYHRHLTLIIGGSGEDLKKWAWKVLGEDLEVPETSDGCHFTHTAKGYIWYFIWLQDFDGSPQAVSTLAHEIIHFVFSSMTDLQLKIAKNCDETFAYFFQSYFQRALKALTSKK